MKADEIIPGKIYEGGGAGHCRKVLNFGASEKYVVWGYPGYVLPLGGYSGPKRVTTRASFAKWAKGIVG